MSITKKNAVSITVKSKTRTKDSAGGYTYTSASISGSPFSGRIIRRSSGKTLVLNEAAPADLNIDKVVLVFPAGTAIKKNYICTVSGIDYTVVGVRTYSRSVQADVEAVK